MIVFKILITVYKASRSLDTTSQKNHTNSKMQYNNHPNVYTVHTIPRIHDTSGTQTKFYPTSPNKPPTSPNKPPTTSQNLNPHQLHVATLLVLRIPKRPHRIPKTGFSAGNFTDFCWDAQENWTAIFGHSSDASTCSSMTWRRHLRSPRTCPSMSFFYGCTQSFASFDDPLSNCMTKHSVKGTWNPAVKPFLAFLKPFNKMYSLCMCLF